MKENPKIFYDYIRNQRYKDSKIGPFKIENEYIYMILKKFAEF